MCMYTTKSSVVDQWNEFNLEFETAESVYHHFMLIKYSRRLLIHNTWVTHVSQYVESKRKFQSRHSRYPTEVLYIIFLIFLKIEFYICI